MRLAALLALLIVAVSSYAASAQGYRYYNYGNFGNYGSGYADPGAYGVEQRTQWHRRAERPGRAHARAAHDAAAAPSRADPATVPSAQDRAGEALSPSPARNPDRPHLRAHAASSAQIEADPPGDVRAAPPRVRSLAPPPQGPTRDSGASDPANPAAFSLPPADRGAWPNVLVLIIAAAGALSLLVAKAAET
jgi:hypothetical protein